MTAQRVLPWLGALVCGLMVAATVVGVFVQLFAGSPSGALMNLIGACAWGFVTAVCVDEGMKR